MKDIVNYNNKGQHHGYQECYYFYDALPSRFNCKNSIIIGYHEIHDIRTTIFHIR